MVNQVDGQENEFSLSLASRARGWPDGLNGSTTFSIDDQGIRRRRGEEGGPVVPSRLFHLPDPVVSPPQDDQGKALRNAAPPPSPLLHRLLGVGDGTVGTELLVGVEGDAEGCGPAP